MRYNSFVYNKEFVNKVESRKVVLDIRDFNITGCKLSHVYGAIEHDLIKTLVSNHLVKFDVSITHINSLYIRPLNPRYDFKDGEGNEILSHTWNQPATINKDQGRKAYNLDTNNTKLWSNLNNGQDNYYSVYTTSNKGRCSKTQLIHGFTLAPDNNIEEIQIWRKGVELQERIWIPIAHMKDRRIRLFLRQPLVYFEDSEENNSDMIEIKFKFYDEKNARSDSVEILGFVVEPNGISSIYSSKDEEKKKE